MKSVVIFWAYVLKPFRPLPGQWMRVRGEMQGQFVKSLVPIPESRGEGENLERLQPIDARSGGAGRTPGAASEGTRGDERIERIRENVKLRYEPDQPLEDELEGLFN